MNHAFLALLLCAACTAPPQSTETSPSQLTEVPARFVRDYFLVKTRINGRGPYQLILDTGASHTVLDPSIYRSTIDRIETGPLTVRHVPAIEHDMAPFRNALGEKVDGILGYPVFRDVLLVLDYPNGRVLVGPGATGQAPKGHVE